MSRRFTGSECGLTDIRHRLVRLPQPSEGAVAFEITGAVAWQYLATPDGDRDPGDIEQSGSGVAPRASPVDDTQSCPPAHVEDSRLAGAFDLPHCRDVEHFIRAAEKQGSFAEPDHEVGDLQEYFRIAWRLLTPQQRQTFRRSHRVMELLETTNRTTPEKCARQVNRQRGSSGRRRTSSGAGALSAGPLERSRLQLRRPRALYSHPRQINATRAPIPGI